MAGNIFDQFDAPAGLPIARAQMIPTPKASENVFDQFDERPAAPTMAQNAKHMYDAELEARTLARQGVSPNAFSKYAPSQPRRLGGAIDYDWGQGYKRVNAETGKEEDVAVDPKAEFVARDPETGELAVFARHSKEAGSEAYNLTNEGFLTRIAREILPGWATGPVTGIQRVAQGAAKTIGTPTGAALATERASEAVKDMQAFKQLEVRPLGPAFNQGPVASIGKQLSETPYIGAPLRNAMDETYKDAFSAGLRIADNIAPNATMEQAGANLQRGLDRYRTAGIKDLEPGAIENLKVPSSSGVEESIRAFSPIQPAETMSAGARKIADQAEKARLAAGDTAVAKTSRGVEVPAARTLDQTIIARRGAEDMSSNELAAIIRAPSSETSFAARQEALYEHAWRQLPERFKINGAKNPDELRAVNTNNAFKSMAAAEERAGISGGIVGGRFSSMAERVGKNVTLDTLRAMRTEIGRALSNFGIYDARLDRTQLKQLYGAISRDIEVGIMTMANRARAAVAKPGTNRPNAVNLEEAKKAEGALYAMRRADRYTRMGIERMDRFSKVVGTENPQQAVGLLVRSALDGSKGNMQMLRTAMSALRPEERAEFASLIFRELGKPKPSAGGLVQEVGFSPESAFTRWNAMNPEAKALLFGGEHAQDIDNYIRVVGRLANLEKLANTSRTGTNTINMTGAAASVGSMLSGNLAMPLGMAGTGYATALLMSRPAYVRWATGYAELKAATLRAPVDVVAPRMIAHINRLGQMAKQNPDLLPVYRAIAAENGVIVDAQKNEQPQQQ